MTYGPFTLHLPLTKIHCNNVRHTAQESFEHAKIASGGFRSLGYRLS